MNMEQIKVDYTNLRDKLIVLENQLNAELSDISKKQTQWIVEEETIENVVKARGNEIVKFNVSGREFKTKLKTLVTFKETFFYKLVLENCIGSHPIYLDRDSQMFEVILNYLRYGVIDYSRFDVSDKKILLFEADYYEVRDIVNYLTLHLNDIQLVHMEINAGYSYQGEKAGTNLIDDLEDKSLMKGICANSPANIILTLNSEHIIKSIEIAGYCGNSKIWNREFGAGASISVSVDRQKWVQIGTIPVGFGSEIKQVNLAPEKAKYIKFHSNSYVGIGYLKLKN